MKTVSQLFDGYKNIGNLDSRQLQGMFRSLYSTPKPAADLRDLKNIQDNKIANDAYSAVSERGIEPVIPEEKQEATDSIQQVPGQTNINKTDVSNTFVDHNITNQIKNENISNLQEGATSTIDNIDKGVSSVENIEINPERLISKEALVPNVTEPVKNIENVDSTINKNVEAPVTNQNVSGDISNVENVTKNLMGDTNIANLPETTPEVISKNQDINEVSDKSVSPVTNILNKQDQLFNTFNQILQKTTAPKSIATLPMMAEGGITKGPSIAGEKGPEAVIPLGDKNAIPVEVTGPSASINVGSEDIAANRDYWENAKEGRAAHEAAQAKEREGLAATAAATNKITGAVQSEMSKTSAAVTSAVQGGAGAGGSGSNMGSQGPIQQTGDVDKGQFNPVKESQRQGFDSDFVGIRDPAYAMRIKAWERIRGEIAYITTV